MRDRLFALHKSTVIRKDAVLLCFPVSVIDKWLQKYYSLIIELRIKNERIRSEGCC